MKHNRPRSRSIIVLLLGATMFLAACEDKINSKGFDQVQTGMTLSQVEKALGTKGELQQVSGMSISGAGIAGGSGASSPDTFIFKKGMKEISITLDKDGKVVSKSKAGF